MLIKYGLPVLKHGSLWAYRLATWSVLVFGLGLAIAVVALRYLLLPDIDSFREPIARAVSGAVGQTVSIGRIEGSWRGYRPELRLFDVAVRDAGGQTGLNLARVDTVVSWVSLLAGRLNFHSLEISRPVLEIRRDSLGMVWIAGDPLGTGEAGSARSGLRRWLLDQRQIIVRNARITWTDEMRSVRPLLIEQANLRIDNEGDRHRFGLTGKPPAELASAVSLRGDFYGEDLGKLAEWRGRLYGEFKYANLALAATWIALPIPVESGLGALHLWIDLAQQRVESATADVNLVNVRTQLRPDLPQLDLTRLSGRLGWQQDASAAMISGRSLSLETAGGEVLPPFDFRLSSGTGVPLHRTLSIAKLELAPFTRLAPFLPLPAEIQQHLGAAQPSGRLREASVAWNGVDGEIGFESARLEFESMALQPVGSLPGVRGFSGSLSANAGGGSVSLTSERGAIELPAVFAAPLPLDFLTADADWKVDGGRVSVNLHNASFTNAHAAGSVSGSYLSAADGPGSVDVTARLIRAEAKDVWRYIPNQALITREWLQHALLSGRATDAKLSLSGPLQAFPFRGGNGGRFEVVAQVEDVRLAYATRWPALEGVAGTLTFRGDEMQVDARAGRVLDVDLGATLARIGDLGGHQEHLLIKGEASGPVAGYLRFIGDSPVAGYINHFTDKMAADGSGRLSLNLDLPLHQASDVKIFGQFQASGSRFTVDPKVPELADYSVAIDFSERGLTISDGRARFLGGPLRFEGGSGKSGGVELTLAGTATAADLGRHFIQPFWRAVQGNADWRGRLSVQDKLAKLSLQSGLKGIGSSLPPPLDKASAAELPVSLALQQHPDGQQELSLAMGTRLSARLLFDDGELRRGGIGFGVAAVLPAVDGINISGKLDMLDVDAWRSALRDPDASRSSVNEGGGPALAGVDLSIGALDIGGRRFSDLGITAQRTAGGWRASVQAQQGKGEATWASAQGGRLTARFSRLVIPTQAAVMEPLVVQGAAPTWRQTLPGLDVVAEDFTFEGKALGRLELLADPDEKRWHLERLQVVNPDGRLDVTGDWAATDRPRTDLQVNVQANDIGKLLGRLGYPQGIKGGSGSLSGPVSWVGVPYRPDVPTISGRLKLDAKNGRFAEAEPGAAKLLGILSLQALPRRLLLDFGDLFSAGFSFERIEADVVLSNGVAQTDDFRMTGSSARVNMKGRVDLAAETQDLQVRVLPQLSTAAAVAGAVVNPAIGVATLLLQKALGDPVEELAAREYHVTGTWAEPIVQRVAREKQPEAASQRK